MASDDQAREYFGAKGMNLHDVVGDKLSYNDMIGVLKKVKVTQGAKKGGEVDGKDVCKGSKDIVMRLFREKATHGSMLKKARRLQSLRKLHVLTRFSGDVFNWL